MTVLQQAHDGKLDLDEKHWIDKKTGGSGILAELGTRSTQMTVDDLAVLMIVLSDNTATNMLIDIVGLDAVTELMFSLGAEETRLQRRMMDTAASARGQENLSTPADAARIMRLLHEGKFIDRATSDRALAILRKEKLGAVKSALPAGVPVAFKPGAIPGVATEWAIVELTDRPYIVVVMGAYGEDAALQQAMKDVSSAAYGFFNRAASSSPYGATIEKH
jgi:beta-lactamase class A